MAAGFFGGRWDTENGPEFSLILHDWKGTPLYKLDAASLYWSDLPCFVSEDGIWMYQHSSIDNSFDFFAVPLDGSGNADAYPAGLGTSPVGE